MMHPGKVARRAIRWARVHRLKLTALVVLGAQVAPPTAVAASATQQWTLVLTGGARDHLMVVAPVDAPAASNLRIDGVDVPLHLTQGLGLLDLPGGAHDIRAPEGAQMTIVNAGPVPGLKPIRNASSEAIDTDLNATFDWGQAVRSWHLDGANALPAGALLAGDKDCRQHSGSTGDNTAALGRAVAAASSCAARGQTAFLPHRLPLDEQAENLMLAEYNEQFGSLGGSGHIATVERVRGAWLVGETPGSFLPLLPAHPSGPVLAALNQMAARPGRPGPPAERAPALVVAPDGTVALARPEARSALSSATATTAEPRRGSPARSLAITGPGAELPTGPDIFDVNSNGVPVGFYGLAGGWLAHGGNVLGNTTPVLGLAGDGTSLLTNTQTITGASDAVAGVGLVEGSGAAGFASSVGSKGGYIGFGINMAQALVAFAQGDTRGALSNVAQGAAALALSNLSKYLAAAGAVYGPLGILAGAILGALLAYAIPIAVGCVVNHTSPGACYDAAAAAIRDGLSFLDPRAFLADLEALLADIFEPDIYVENHSGHPVHLDIHVDPDRTYDVRPSWADGSWAADVGSNDAISVGGAPVPNLHYETRAAAPWQTEAGWVLPRREFAAWARRVLPGYGFGPAAVEGFVKAWSMLGQGEGEIAIFPQDRALVDRVQPLTVDRSGVSIQREWFFVRAATPGDQPLAPSVSAPAAAEVSVEEWGVLFGHGARPGTAW
jgi:hypothetical protein